MSGTRRQGTLWMGTLPDVAWEPCLPEGISYIRGQKERGAGGLEHFQVFFILPRKASLSAVSQLWRPYVGHWELTRSAAIEDYHKLLLQKLLMLRMKLNKQQR